MRKRRIFFTNVNRTIASFLVLGLSIGNLCAHETWLTPSSFSGPIRKPIRFDLTSGMKFPELEYAIRPERIAEAHIRLNGDRSDLKRLARTKKSFRFERAFPSSGVVTAWVRLFPKTLELSDAEVTEYLDEIDAPQGIRDTWNRWKGKGPWKETYTKSAKTFLRIGEGAGDDSWNAPVGLPLEILPSTNPTAWKSGDKAECQLLENGKPLPEIALGLIKEGSSKRVFARTDSEGHATFILDDPGRVLLFAVHLRREGDAWKSTFTTLTVHVAP